MNKALSEPNGPHNKAAVCIQPRCWSLPLCYISSRRPSGVPIITLLRVLVYMYRTTCSDNLTRWALTVSKLDHFTERAWRIFCPICSTKHIASRSRDGWIEYLPFLKIYSHPTHHSSLLSRIFTLSDGTRSKSLRF